MWNGRLAQVNLLILPGIGFTLYHPLQQLSKPVSEERKTHQTGNKKDCFIHHSISVFGVKYILAFLRKVTTTYTILGIPFWHIHILSFLSCAAFGVYSLLLKVTSTLPLLCTSFHNTQLSYSYTYIHVHILFLTHTKNQIHAHPHPLPWWMNCLADLTHTKYNQRSLRNKQKK